MPYTQPFTILNYDCDAYGHLRTSAYLSLLEESDHAAMSALGLSPAEPALSWLPRRIEVEFLAPLLPNELAWAHTRLAGCDGQLSRREYALQAEGKAQPACLAALDWGLYDQNSQNFVPIPNYLLHKIKQGVELDTQPGETPFPALATPPSGALTLDWQVSWGETGQGYRLTNRALIDRLIESGLQSGERYRWTLRQAQEQGVVFVARKLWLEIEQPAVYADLLRVTTWLTQLKRSTVVRQYRVQRARDGEPVARAQTLWVYLDLQTTRPIRIPPDFADAWREHLV